MAMMASTSSEVSEEPTATLQPLLIETVVETLFSYISLDFQSLKSARLVCKPWMKAAEGHFLERGAVRFGRVPLPGDSGGGSGDGDKEGVDEGILLGPDIKDLTKRMKVLRWLDKKSSLSLKEVDDLDNLEEDQLQQQYRRFKNYVWVHAQWKVPNPIRDYFTNRGVFVKCLKLRRPRYIPIPSIPNGFAEEKSYFNMEFLVKVLKHCPNLEELEAFALGIDFHNNDNSTGMFKLCLLGLKQVFKLKKLTLLLETSLHELVLQTFFEECRLLEDFSVTYRFVQGNDYDLLKNLFGLGASGSNKVNLARLRSLNMAWEGIVASTEVFQLMCRQPLPNLDYLRIAIPNEADEGAFSAMLEHLSGSLRHFRLANVTRTAVLGFIPRIPRSMTKLETLELHVGCNQLLMGILESVVDLPNLKTLLLHRETIHETRGFVTPGAQYDFSECWSLLPGNWAANRQKTLETLELPCGLTRAEHFLQILAVFPKVRDLRLQNPSDEVIRAVFAEGTHLERLSIRLMAFPKKIDSLLTGLRPKICSHMVKEGKYCLKDPNQVTDWGPGLRDMKNLQYFELRQWNQTNWMTEVSLWHGFIHLTRAYRLVLGLGEVRQLSDGALAALQSALGSRCVIDIDKRIRAPTKVKETPETRLCYWEFWSRDMTKSGVWKTCTGPCCNVFDY